MGRAIKRLKIDVCRISSLPHFRSAAASVDWRRSKLCLISDNIDVLITWRGVNRYAVCFARINVEFNNAPTIQFPDYATTYNHAPPRDATETRATIPNGEIPGRKISRSRNVEKTTAHHRTRTRTKLQVGAVQGDGSRFFSLKVSFRGRTKFLPKLVFSCFVETPRGGNNFNECWWEIRWNTSAWISRVYNFYIEFLTITLNDHWKFWLFLAYIITWEDWERFVRVIFFFIEIYIYCIEILEERITNVRVHEYNRCYSQRQVRKIFYNFSKVRSLRTLHGFRV